jgi:hypothetical protein
LLRNQRVKMYCNVILDLQVLTGFEKIATFFEKPALKNISFSTLLLCDVIELKPTIILLSFHQEFLVFCYKEFERMMTVIQGYYKRNRHFQCCIETKLLMI